MIGTSAPRFPSRSRFGSPAAAALALALLMPGCLSGTSYPKTYASTYCAALFTCVDDTEIENWTNYDDEKDCRDDLQAEMEGTSVYDAFEEGDRSFDGDAADACITEADQVRDDADCGSMNFIQFVLDAATEECEDVYPPAE